MNFLIHSMMFWILAAVLPLGFWGCAARSAQQPHIQAGEYRKIMERQKAQTAPQEAEAPKIPELTADGYEKLGDRHLSQGNLDLAFTQYQKALQKDPGQLRVRYKTGFLFLKKGLLEEAKQEFQDILKVEPRHSLALEGMGRAFFYKGEMNEAERYLREAVDIDPALWQAHNFLGVIHDRQGRFSAAIAEYREAIDRKPNLGFLWNNLGISLFLSGEPEKAAGALQEALRLGPPHPKTYNNLALALGKLGRYPEALEALKMRGDEPLAHYDLGCIYMTVGKNREAVEAFEKAIELKPGFYVEAHEKMRKAKAAMSVGIQ